jgi:hypothetical protein
MVIREILAIINVCGNVIIDWIGDISSIGLSRGILSKISLGSDCIYIMDGE